MGILRKITEICGVISFLVACLGIANNDGAISIPGFIDLELSSSTFPAPGYVTGSMYVATPITASYENSSSLEHWIYNL